MLLQKRKKILKIAGGIFFGFIALLIILFAVIQIYVNTHKQSLLKLVNEKLSDAIAGEVSVKDIEVNVWRHFPSVNIRIKDINLKDSVYNKSLLKVKYVSTRLNVLKLIGGEVDIHNVYLEDGVIHLFTDKNGYSNTYIFKQNKTKQPGAHPAIIDEIELKNIHFVTQDAVKNKWYGVKANYIHADLDYADSITKIEMTENVLVRGLGFNLAKGYFLKNKVVKADWNLAYNSKSKQLSFAETPVDIGASHFKLKGDFFLADTLNAHFKLIVKSDAIDYKEAASLVSPNISDKINLVSLTKPLALTAIIEGPMAFRTIPIVNVQWVVKDNQLVTPVITLDKCAFTGSFTNERNKAYPRTDDNSEVLLTKLSASWGGISLIANTNTIVTNLVHPILQFDFSSTTTLSELDERLGLSTLRFISGGALLNVQYNGPLGIDPSKLQYLSGNLVIKDAEVNYEPRNLTFSHCNGEIIFSQTDLLVKNLQCDLNTNHFKVEVVGNNLNLLAQTSLPGKASLLCNVFTPDLDLTDFKTLFQARRVTVSRKKNNRSTANSLVQLDDALQNGTLDMNLTANAVHLNRFTARNVVARLGFKNNDINVTQVSLQHADGTLKMEANVHQINNNYHEASTKLLLDNINVQKLFYAFNNFGMTGLTSSHLRGILTMKGNLNLGIDNKGNVLPKTMLGNLHFSLKRGSLINYKPLMDIQKIVFKNRNLDNIEFAELKDSLELKRNEIYIHRMEIESSALTAYIEGIYSFADNTNISIQVPLSNLKKRDDDYEVKNKGAKRKAGASVYLRAKSDGDGGVKIGLDIFKKLRGNNFEKEFRDDSR